ncbi:MAG: 5-(carboxyamino)imidazole ribonucleotide synthase [Balneolaceae bacterium]
MSKTSLSAKTKIGFLGAGQLARMSALQAFRFGIKVAVFSDRTEDEPVQFMTPYAFSGSFDSVDDMVKFARTCDVVTLENEFISSAILQEVQDKSGTPIFPSPESFALIENKLVEKQTFEKAGIPVTPYRLVRSESDLQEFGNEFGWPYLLKSSKGGYDGYGNAKASDLESANEGFRTLGGADGHDILAEAFVPFTKELAVQVARNETGIVVYPCCETVQENHINVAVLSPAPIEEKYQQKAQEFAVKAIEAIDGKGIFAFEFFLTVSGEVLLNESAPRPHNSGHYTIEGCITSQFENHVRSVLGLPLGSSKMTSQAAAMINLLGTHNRPAETDHIVEALSLENGHLHVYGKIQSKIGRKMAHYTLLGDNLEETHQEAISICRHIEI